MDAARVDELRAELNRNRARIAILGARAEHLEQLILTAEKNKEKAEKSVAELTSSLSSQKDRIRGLEEGARKALDEKQELMERLERAGSRQKEGKERLFELESRLRGSEKAREESLIENVRHLTQIAEGETALKAAQKKVAEGEASRLGRPEPVRLDRSSASNARWTCSAPPD